MEQGLGGSLLLLFYIMQTLSNRYAKLEKAFNIIIENHDLKNKDINLLNDLKNLVSEYHELMPECVSNYGYDLTPNDCCIAYYATIKTILSQNADMQEINTVELDTMFDMLIKSAKPINNNNN